MRRTSLRILVLATISFLLGMAGLSWGADVLPSLTFEDDETVEPKPEAPVPGVPISEVAVENAVTDTMLVVVDESLSVAAARGQGIDFLKALAEKDPAGFVAPPIRQSIVVGYEEKLLRYAEKLIDVPVYETVEVYQNVKVGESVDAAKIRQKVKVKKWVGTTKEKRVVLDRNGDIEKLTKMPKYGEGGPDEWRSFLFGHNAMAIYALIQAGVDPSDEAVTKPAEALLLIYEQYGAPDTTWDLAWSIAAFSEFQGSGFQSMAREMAGKLMDGQIADGAAAGLWGPVCLNTRLLAAMTVKQNEYTKFYLAAKAKVADKKDSGGEARMAAALDALRLFEKLMKRATMLGTSAWEGKIFIPLRDASGVALPINVSNYSSYIVNQTAADMESTAIALFGMKIAIEKKLLPKEAWRPNDEKGVPIIPPKMSDDVLRTAVAAIAKAQSRGGWSEMNIHQPVVDFNSMKTLDGVPADPKSFVPLVSAMTETSTAQGYSTFACLAKAYGVRGLTAFARNVVAANGVLKAALDSGIKSAKGGQIAPYDFCFFLSDVPDLGQPEFDLKASQQIAEFLVENQNVDGSWGGKPQRSNMQPSSLRERIAVLPYRYPPVQGQAACNVASAHVLLGPVAEKRNGMMTRLYTFPTKVMATSYALLSLAEEKTP